MDQIRADKAHTPHMGNTEHLCIYINGKRLDLLLSEQVEKNYLGLIPAWLDYYDADFSPSRKEKEYVWAQTRLENDAKVLPILLCPDDFDFSCIVIVVEVIDKGDHVIWNCFGKDVTRFSPKESELPKYIGTEVRWFSAPGPYLFSKQEYLDCIHAFEALPGNKTVCI